MDDEHRPTREERDALRARQLAKSSRWYSPHVHLLVPSSFGFAVIACAIWVIHDLRWLEVLTIPLTWMIANATEWRAHRDLLHARSWIAPVLYDRHTPEHHMIYTSRDMAMREVREWRLVLIPPYGILLIFLVTCPVTAGLWHLGVPNVAALFAATSMGYVVSYEWLHLSYHLGPETWVGRLAILDRLRRQHAVHHDPRLMQRKNFNVTVPFWDWVRGTTATPAEVACAFGTSVTASEFTSEPCGRPAKEAPADSSSCASATSSSTSSPASP